MSAAKKKPFEGEQDAPASSGVDKDRLAEDAKAFAKRPKGESDEVALMATVTVVVPPPRMALPSLQPVPMRSPALL